MSDGKENVDVAKEAAEYIFGDHHSGFVAVAHNASSYDGQFILESLISSNKAAPEICLDETKLIFMKHNNVRLLDSLKYLTMSLSAVGKTFHVDSLKGDFLILFIKPENYKYVGPLPNDGLENKSLVAKKQIIEFLQKERKANKVFNFMDDIFNYCFNDVYMLSETTTAASAAALVFHRNHLDPEKPVVSDAKTSVSINNSVMSQKYLARIGSTENVQINISTIYVEEKVVNHRVDGFIPPCEKEKQEYWMFSAVEVTTSTSRMMIGIDPLLITNYVVLISFFFNFL
ncbi:hypothetical protein CAEBREN_20271 [Caenorhabditis brenneri]|uniref:DNA-directed DNA polymerase n=1 Tax=Caenorhabditis brenneri TaxID=135651 RepID=G0NXD5_CAEBE|nr:hypothetical protein CAEBREN_20271 [Caenorhabditis brenneri]